MNTRDELLTTKEAADYLKFKETTLEQWRWRGNGPRFVKLGRSVRYRRSDLDEYAAAATFTSTTEAGHRAAA